MDTTQARDRSFGRSDGGRVGADPNLLHPVQFCRLLVPSKSASPIAAISYSALKYAPATVRNSPTSTEMQRETRSGAVTLAGNLLSGPSSALHSLLQLNCTRGGRVGLGFELQLGIIKRPFDAPKSARAPRPRA